MKRAKKRFLPVNAGEMRERGVERPDFVLVTGDAYIDHPSFGAAIVGRLLESLGYAVCVLAQPDWRDAGSFAAFGEPRLAFLVTAGNIDSMVNNYTAAKKRRARDVYSPGGAAGGRPDRACVVYANKIRERFKNAVIILGGLEASLRRLAHYDYWDDKVRRSVLLDSAADALVYGMGERQVTELAKALESGVFTETLPSVRGVVYKTRGSSAPGDFLRLPDFADISADTDEGRRLFAKSFLLQYRNTEHGAAKGLIEYYGDVCVVQNPPQPPLSTPELDKVHALPFAGTYHDMYDNMRGTGPAVPAIPAIPAVPAIEEVKFSIISSRGCFGACSFCALAFHQGRSVTARSHASIIREAEALTWDADFKGYIHDVGGPTANFRGPACEKQAKYGGCADRQCLFPKPCPRLKVSHADYLALLRRLRALPRVKKVFVRSGLRYDYIVYDKSDEFMRELCAHHVSGQLKVAPEHVSARVLEKMGKPGRDVYEAFTRKFYRINAGLEASGKKQYLVPYLISGHPGSDLSAAVELAEYLRDIRHAPEQVQDFYPTPGTLSTCMYYTGLDPRDGSPVYTARTPREKAMQRALLQYRLPRNYELVRAALKLAGRGDLIGFDKHCLIRPHNIKHKTSNTVDKTEGDHVIQKHKGRGEHDRRPGDFKGHRR